MTTRIFASGLALGFVCALHATTPRLALADDKPADAGGQKADQKADKKATDKAGSKKKADKKTDKAEGGDKTAEKADAKKPKGTGTADSHYAAGERAFNDDDFVKAVDELGTSIALRPTARACQLLGRAHVKLEQFDEARNAWQMALKLEKRAALRGDVQKLIKSIEGLSSAKMRIDSQPEGGTVYLDMKAAGARGKTPLELSMRPGRHRVIVVMEGFDESVAVPDPVAKLGEVTPVNVLLRPKGCDLSLQAKQHEVVATIDGGAPQALPTMARVTIGKHNVTFSGRQLAARSSEIECKDFQPLSLPAVELDKLPNGMLAIQSKPGWLIAVDEETIDLERAKNLQVSPDTPHRIEVKEAGKTPWVTTVSVKSGEVTDVKPEPQVGQIGTTGLVVKPEPTTALVFVDGKKFEPDVLSVVRQGKHQIEVRQKGFVPYVDNIDIKEGDIYREDARMKKRSKTPLWVAIGLTAVGAGAAGFGAYAALQTRDLGPAGNHDVWFALQMASWATAGACGATAIALYSYYAVDSRRGLENLPDASTQKPSVRVGASLLPGGGGLVLSGAF